VVMQPVGVVGIVSPWNYPIQLSLAPLIGALAAGNRVMIKPSELAGDVASILKSMIAETFAPDHVTVVTGGPDVGEAFTQAQVAHQRGQAQARGQAVHAINEVGCIRTGHRTGEEVGDGVCTH